MRKKGSRAPASAMRMATASGAEDFDEKTVSQPFQRKTVPGDPGEKRKVKRVEGISVGGTQRSAFVLRIVQPLATNLRTKGGIGSRGIKKNRRVKFRPQ